MKKLLSLALAAILAVSVALPVSADSKLQATPREQDDYYTAINQQWLNESKIPAGSASWGNFEAIGMQLNGQLGELMTGLLKNRSLSIKSDEKKMTGLYVSAMDYASRNKDGVGPIKPYLDRINGAKNVTDVVKVATDLTKVGFSSILTYGIFPDEKDSNTNALHFSVADLGLQNRDYYLANDPQILGIQTAYKNYLETLFTLKGDEAKVAKKKALAVFAFEKSLAGSVYGMEESRDPSKMYTVMTIDQLKTLSPNLNWPNLLKELKLSEAKKIVVAQPAYYKALNGQLKVENLDSLKAFLEAVVLRGTSGYLSSGFEKAGFEYSRVFTGIAQMSPREERAFNLASNSFGDVLGKLYVTKYFPQAAKDDVKLLVSELLKAYEVRINGLDWMSQPTKERAIRKLRTMTVKIGFPDQWQTYGDVVIKSYKEGGSLAGNMIGIRTRGVNSELMLLNKPVDKKSWGLTAQTINAFYNPSANEIVFPAAFLQAPFYQYGASKATNLGAIGVVIGHEISHAFDDSGSMFDENGNMVNWWTPEDFAKYKEKTKKLATEFSTYEMFPGVFVNGNLTLGENIADLGGVTAALEVLKADAKPDYKTFFTSYAVMGRNIALPEMVRAMLQQDPHTPGIYRVNGVVTNLDLFYEVYGLKAGDKLYKKPEDRVKIW